MLLFVHSGAFLCGVDVVCAVMISTLEIIGLKKMKKVLYLKLVNNKEQWS